MGVYPQLVKSNEPDAKKRFGQHFLRDTGVLDRILRWMQPGSDDVFLEIGAGTGALSTRLAPQVSRLLAIEVDRDCIPHLQGALSGMESASIISADILQLDLAELVSQHLQPGQKLKIAGNLPYNIATVIIARMLHSPLPITDMYFMVQLEVAARILAHPGSRDYGYLSVLCQHYADVRMGFKVSSACFVPRPKVSSAMFSLHPKPRLRAADADADAAAYQAAFEELCKACFAYRRKTVANSLQRHALFGPIGPRLLAAAGIDGTIRAEQIPVRDYENLAAVYQREFAGGRS